MKIMSDQAVLEEGEFRSVMTLGPSPELQSFCPTLERYKIVSINQSTKSSNKLNLIFPQKAT